MKKLFSESQFFQRSSLVAALLAMLPLTSIAQDAASDAKEDSAKAKAPVAVHGTAKVDGEVDESWAQAVEFDVKKPVSEETRIDTDKMATAKVKIMWDAEHLYAFWQVTDPKLSDASAEDYQHDSIEFFVDENNEKAGTYQSDDAQYRVSYKGKLSGGETSKTENVTAVAKAVDGGYIVEMSVKLNDGKLEAGKKLGLELQVNDDDGTGSRVAVAKWHHPQNDSYLSTTDFGTVELVETSEK